MKRLLVLVSAVAALASCTSATTAPVQENPKTLTLLAYDAFTPEPGIFKTFTNETGIDVKVVTSGDSGVLISKAILTAGKPEGDVLWGIDNTMLSRAQQASLLTSYEPVDIGDICVNADKDWFAGRKIPVPARLEDLVLPQYRHLLVTQDPVASSPGLGFLLGTIAHFGEGKWQKYWSALKNNGAHIAPDWTTAYTVDFSGSSGNGKYPLVVSYGSSPPAEVLYADPSTPITEPTTSVIESTCFRQTEYVGVMRGSAHATASQLLISYLLGKKFQESMPLSLFVFPVNPNAKLPDLFIKFAVRAKTPLTISPQDIEKNRENWLKEWRALLL
jgi:thiamine transport system substrate-binding protein